MNDFEIKTFTEYFKKNHFVLEEFEILPHRFYSGCGQSFTISFKLNNNKLYAFLLFEGEDKFTKLEKSILELTQEYEEYILDKIPLPEYFEKQLKMKILHTTVYQSSEIEADDDVIREIISIMINNSGDYSRALNEVLELTNNESIMISLARRT